MGGTKLLTNEPHRDGSPSRRNRPDGEKSVDHGVVRAEDKQITSEPRKSSSTKKSGGTPMKMLIAQEMSKETDSKRKQTNVVARLMGLDEALPVRQSVVNGGVQLARSVRTSRVTLAGALKNSRQLEDGYFDRSLPCGVHSFGCEKEYRDVYEVWQQPPRTNHFKDQSLQKERYIEIQNERRMALVRQKFMEAKRLATDEKLLQSKEFQDALEVLSSNRDLFLKFLEEPNSLFSSHLKELHSTPAAPQTKRITVLKPSRTVDTNGDTQVKQQQQQQHPVTVEGGWDLDTPRRSSSMTQPTRIVVLKPSPGNHHDPKPMITPRMSSQELMENGDFNQLLETTESMGSREAARDITRQISETVNSNRRDESLLSSVLSNGYVGDESSFNRSETEYGEEDGIFCDAEIPSPTSRHSWDYSNRFGSPYSLSSPSRASYSPEPLVIREAKKRLSERWSLVASNGNSGEQKDMRISTSTLGEMLAISEVKKEEGRVGGLTVSSSRSYGGEEDLRVSSSSSSTSQTKNGDGVERSPWSLSRSKSLPVSSAFENVELNLEVLNSVAKKPVTAKDTAKFKSGISSFKGKVSSLFFSWNKKGGRKKSIPSLVGGSGEVGKDGSIEPVDKGNDILHPVNNSQSEGCPQVNSEEGSFKVSSPTVVKGILSEQGTHSFRAVLSLEKPNASASLSDNQKDPSSSNKIGENQNQPSPTSVLDAPFEDETTNSTPDSSGISNAGHSVAPIVLVARTLSWDDTNLEISSPDTSNFARPLCKAIAEEQQRHSFVHSIISTAGLDKNSVFSRWHSVDCPLDPTLLEKFLDRKEEDAKSRERRSNQRLMFDCINYALLEIGRVTYLGAYPWARAYNHTRKKASAGSSPMGDEVWALMSDWFSGEGKFVSGETDNIGLVVDRSLRKDVGGNGWAESMLSEIDEISKEIGDKVFDELVAEALADF